MDDDPFKNPTLLMQELRQQVQILQNDLEVEKRVRSGHIQGVLQSLDQERHERQLSCQEISQALSTAVFRIDGESDRSRRRLGGLDRDLLKEINDRVLNCNANSQVLAKLSDERSDSFDKLKNLLDAESEHIQASIKGEIENRTLALDALDTECRLETERIKSESKTTISVMANKHQTLLKDHERSDKCTQSLLIDVQDIGRHLRSMSQNWGAVGRLKFHCVESNEVGDKKFEPQPPATPSTMAGTSPLSHRSSPVDRSSPVVAGSPKQVQQGLFR